MRFFIPSGLWAEADFYTRMSVELAELGHDVSHLLLSRRATDAVRRHGFTAYCLPELMSESDGVFSLDAEVARIEREYDLVSLRDVYITDPVCRNRPESWCVERTVRHFRAFEKVFDEVRPDVVVNEVSRGTMPMVSHLMGLARGATVAWQLHSIFPRSLRLYANTYHAPIVPEQEVRELSPDERQEVEDFIHAFTTKARPVLDYQVSTVTVSKFRALLRGVAAHAVYERDHEYLWPGRWLLNPLKVRARRALSRPLYGHLDPDRPFVYFPLHDAIDFKIERVIPHCANQEYLIRLVAESLPQGYDVVVKEHPYSIGQNPASMLRRLSRIANVTLVDPFTSSHDLMKRAQAITVISSTVGIESLLYEKPVLTMGQPYYSGYGVTLDIDSFREIREAVPAVLRFKPDRERILRFLHAGMRSTYDALPAWLDQTDDNAAKLAGALDTFARRHAAKPARIAV